MNHRLEKLLWSVAIPGFGQLLNGKYIKALLFISLEFVINVKAHLNQAIMLSFQGDTAGAVRATCFQWLMFYPCVYMFALWDAYRDTTGGYDGLTYLGFVLPAYFGTVGIVFSPKFRILGYLIGPVWLPMALAFVGVAAGLLVSRIYQAWTPPT